jgi:hypothetical protein
MSGPENLRGIDYQVSCSVLLILSTLADESSPLTVVHVESLDDEGEDLALEFQDGRVLQIQLKKLAEGYNWTPAGLRPVLSRFSRLDKTSECLFISDGSASRQFTPLRQFLEGTGDLTDEERDSVCGDGLSAEDLEALRGRVRIQTRFFPSPDDADPARYVTGEIHRLLLRGPFSLEKDATDIAAGLWRTLYDAGSAALRSCERSGCGRVTWRHEKDSLPNRFDRRAVGDRSLRHAWGEERPHRHAPALPAARDLERHLLPGQERRHLESAPARLPTLAGGLAAVPSLAR